MKFTLHNKYEWARRVFTNNHFSENWNFRIVLSSIFNKDVFRHRHYSSYQMGEMSLWIIK